VTLGEELSPWSVVPFAGLLLAIAVLPLVAHHFWESNRNKAWISAVAAAPVAVYLVAGFGARGIDELVHKVHEYVAFIALLGSLFVVTGCIHVRGSLSGTPLLNTAVLGVGAVLANAIGTTGASVLLIRPLLAANEARRNVAHIAIFFIFVVSNSGGLLTPLGDPPLFLGFLKGVPFGWTLSLWAPWLFVNGLLLLIFNVWDQIAFAREERARRGSQLEQVQRHAPLGLDGGWNFLALLAIVAVIYASGSGLGNGGQSWPFGIAEAGMVAISALSWVSTAPAIRRSNRFGFGPINEVAILFAGLFVTMAPALLLLNANAGALGVLRSPASFFWATGLISGFLDNAPTYLAFAALACGLEGIDLEGRYLAELLARGPEAARVLAAISCGAVFMGANTYIGNGPNFMVKAIAEERGVRMPGFFGYMLYSGAVMLPVCAIAALRFL
jgi:Na+/H+ antiporter NhaD/arsenite permease-like protein